MDGWTGGGLTERSQSLLLINHCSVSDLSFAKGAKKKRVGGGREKEAAEEGGRHHCLTRPCKDRDGERERSGGKKEGGRSERDDRWTAKWSHSSPGDDITTHS